MSNNIHPNLRAELDNMSEEQIEKILNTKYSASDIVKQMKRLEQIKEQLCNPEEVTIEGWVARDEDGLLHLFDVEPERIAECAWAYFPGHTLGFSLPKEYFPEVTWESEPKRVRITITPLDQ